MTTIYMGQKGGSPIQFDLKTLVDRKEFRVAYDLACERLAGRELSVPEQAECNLVACFAALNLGDAAEAIVRGEAAYVTARLAADPDLTGRAIINSAQAYNSAGLYAKALQRISEFDQLRDRYSTGLQAEAALVSFNKAVWCRKLGQNKTAAEYMRTAYQLALEQGRDRAADKYRSNLVDLLLRLGDCPGAAALIEAGDLVELDDPADQALHNLWQKIDRANYSLRMDQVGPAYELCVEALAASPSAELRAVTLFLLFELASATGQTEEALGLSVLSAHAAAEAGRRDLLDQAQTAAMQLARTLAPGTLEQMMSKLRSVALAGR